MAYRIIDLPVVEAGTEPDAAVLRRYEQANALDRRDSLALFGHDDLTDTVEAQLVFFASQTDKLKWWLLAVDDNDDVVGAARVSLPMRDNRRLAELELQLDPTEGTDRPAVLDALWSSLLPRFAEHHRTVVQLWNGHPIAAEGEPTLVPATGSGAIRRDEYAELIAGLGFTLEQVERQSTLVVADHRTNRPELRAAAGAAAVGYDLISFTGVTPPELRGELAVLKNRMSVDVPAGALDVEEEDWDAERVERQDRSVADRGTDQFTTVARHRDTGRLAAYTQLMSPRAKPASGWQADTLVHGEHRGHRLGLLIKLATLDLIEREAPAIERIHTWNADENAHMLAINVALGFRPVSAEGAWQLRIG